MISKHVTDNPCGLDGFAFLEFSGPIELLQTQFQQMGFQLTAKHSQQSVFRYQQGDIQFIINDAEHCQAQRHRKQHGAGACAMGFQVHDAAQAFQMAIQHGATPFIDNNHVHHGLPAIEGIGGSVIYFTDHQHQPFRDEWQEITTPTHLESTTGLKNIDHLTHNVHRGHMTKWAQFYANIFNFHEIRYFDIKGQVTGLLSRALSSPCGKIKIPLNESQDDKSQIEEFLRDYRGEGIQHIALTTDNICQTVRQLRLQGQQFLDVPDSYYTMVNDRLPWHQEDLAQLQQEKILIDGAPTAAGGLLLQIFTKNVFGPVFFEIIERHGNEGFGEGNFQALFEAMERDQILRGAL